MVPSLILTVDDFKRGQSQSQITVSLGQPLHGFMHIPTALPDLLSERVAAHQHNVEVRVKAVDDQLTGRGC